MKRVTILFDDEHLYRNLKAEAAKEGRTVKEVVSEALNAWLRSRGGLTRSQQERRAAALRETDETRSKQVVHEVIEPLFGEIRDELTKGSSIVETKKFVYYQEEDMFVGWLEEYPDYRTQGESLEELKENLVDIYRELTSGRIPCVRTVGELNVA